MVLSTYCLWNGLSLYIFHGTIVLTKLPKNNYFKGVFLSIIFWERKLTELIIKMSYV